MRENKARAAARAAVQVDEVPVSKKDSGGSWKEKRERWAKYYSEHPGLDAPAGEIANMIDGLTPEGHDKKGRKVSFVESGRDLTGRSSRISSRPFLIGKY